MRVLQHSPDQRVNSFQDGKCQWGCIRVIMLLWWQFKFLESRFISLTLWGEIIFFRGIGPKSNLSALELGPVQDISSRKWGEKIFSGDDPRNQGAAIRLFLHHGVYERFNRLIEHYGYIHVSQWKVLKHDFKKPFLGSFWMKLTFNSTSNHACVALLIGFGSDWLGLTRHLRKNNQNGSRVKLRW